MSSLLSNHSIFEWENYGVEWEIDLVIPFELMDKHLVSDRYKLNNWSNLAPKTSEQNKKDRPGRVGDAGGGMAGQSPSSSLPSSSVRRALKAPPITWGMGEGARRDHRGREASLWEGWLIGRGDVRGRE